MKNKNFVKSHENYEFKFADSFFYKNLLFRGSCTSLRPTASPCQSQLPEFPRRDFSMAFCLSLIRSGFLWHYWFYKHLVYLIRITDYARVIKTTSFVSKQYSKSNMI